jgi:hypothetical protein
MAREVIRSRSGGAGTDMINIKVVNSLFANDWSPQTQLMLSQNDATFCEVCSDGSVNIKVDVITTYQYKRFPRGVVNKIDGSLRVHTKWKSLINCPKHITGNLFCNHSRIRSLEGIKFVGGNVFADNLSFMGSLKGIEKTNADMVIRGTLVLDDACTHLVGLSYVQGVKTVKLGGSIIDVVYDPFLWQEKLLEMGLVEQAQL